MRKWKKGLQYSSAQDVLTDLLANKIVYWKNKAYSAPWIMGFHIRELSFYGNFYHAVPFKKTCIIQTDLFGNDDYAKDRHDE
jgi:hypothetical protein